MIVERFPPEAGGSGIRFYKIAEHLSKKHTIDVFTLGLTDTWNRIDNFHVYRFDPENLPIPNFYSLKRVIGFSASTFLKLLFRSYDLLDVDVWPFLPVFSSKIAKLQTPLIISWNVVWPFSIHKEISKICFALGKTVSRMSTYNITISQFAKSILHEKLGINTNKIKVISNGIDDLFMNAKVVPQWGRLIFVGRLEPQKRLDLILRTFEIAKKRGINIELYIFGSGSLYEWLLHFSKKNIGIHVYPAIEAQNREKLISELVTSWAFISASEFETYGLTLMEALSLGLPVISTDAPYNAAPKENLRHNYNGLIVEHNNPNALADAIEKLYKNDELWRNLSHNAKYGTEFSSWSDIAKEVEITYEKVAKGEI
jgi:glycosyltransferase involved in cell wall biosynthesis